MHLRALTGPTRPCIVGPQTELTRQRILGPQTGPHGRASWGPNQAHKTAHLGALIGPRLDPKMHGLVGPAGALRCTAFWAPLGPYDARPCGPR